MTALDSTVSNSSSPNWMKNIIILALLAVAGFIAFAGVVAWSDHVTMAAAATTQTLTRTAAVGTVQVMLTPTEGGCNYDASFTGNTIPAFSKQGKFDGPCSMKSALTALLDQFLTNLENDPQPDLWLEHIKVIDFISSILSSL